MEVWFAQGHHMIQLKIVEQAIQSNAGMVISNKSTETGDIQIQIYDIQVNVQ